MTISLNKFDNCELSLYSEPCLANLRTTLARNHSSYCILGNIKYRKIRHCNIFPANHINTYKSKEYCTFALTLTHVTYAAE